MVKKTVDNLQQIGDQRFRTLIEQSTDVIQLLNEKADVLYTSESVRRVLGFSPQEIKGKNPLPFVHPEDLPYFQKKFATLVKKPRAQVHAEYRVKHKNGHWVWIEATGVNHLKTPGINAIVGNFRDISERKLSQEREQFLEKASTLFNSTIDYQETLRYIAKLLIPQMADYCRVVILDEENNIKEIAAYHEDKKKLALVKKLYESYKGQTSNTHGVSHLIKTGKSEIIPQLTPQIMKSVAGNKQLVATIRALGLQSYMGVAMKRGNKVVGAITFSSSRKGRIYTNADLVLAEELARRAAYAVENALLFANAQKAINMRDEFISVASHELKTPLTSLKIYNQIIQKQLAGKVIQKHLKSFKKMDTQIDKLVTLIQDLLSISKIQVGQLEFHKKKFLLSQLVEEIVENVGQTAKHKIVIQGEVKKKVVGDKDRIGQVLTNLLTNAVKYSPEAKEIVVTLKSSKKDASISVKDFGIGIDKKHQKKIFDRFYRVTGPNEKTFPGLGIGLYISYNIINKHGGTMTVRSTKGKGAEFIFTLPFASAR